jgi:CheY-like chemotaxis protein
VLILDIHLPHMSGLEALQIIRQETSEEIPTIIVSSQVDDEVMAKALALHAFTVMSKMRGVHSLLRAVAKALHRYYSL